MTEPANEVVTKLREPFSFDLGADYRSDDGRTEITHQDGVAWFRAPLPPRQHACWAQTTAWHNFLDLVERCPCGAIRRDGRHGVWMERNRRRDDERGGQASHEPRLLGRLLARVGL